MKLTVNGQMRDVADGLTVSGLLDLFNLAGERVAVECNGDILSKDAFASHALQEGDTLEVVRFVGGG